MSLRAERSKGVAIQFLKKLYILWITSDFSNPRNDNNEEFFTKENIFCNTKQTLKKLSVLKICNILKFKLLVKDTIWALLCFALLNEIIVC